MGRGPDSLSTEQLLYLPTAMWPAALLHSGGGQGARSTRVERSSTMLKWRRSNDRCAVNDTRHQDAKPALQLSQYLLVFAHETLLCDPSIARNYRAKFIGAQAQLNVFRDELNVHQVLQYLPLAANEIGTKV